MGYWLDRRITEPALFEPNRRPSGPVCINWNDPTTKNLVGCCGAGDTPLVNLVNGTLPSSTSNVTYTSGAITLTSGFIQYNDFFPDTDDNGFTIFARCSNTGDRENDYIAGWGAASTNAGPHIGFIGLGAGAVPRIYMAVWGDGTFENTGPINDSNIHTWVGRLGSDSTSGALYIDGAEITTGTLNASSLNTRSGYIGALPNGGNNWTGTIDFFCAWERPLSLGEIKQLNENCYKFIAPV